MENCDIMISGNYFEYIPLKEEDLTIFKSKIEEDLPIFTLGHTKSHGH